MSELKNILNLNSRKIIVNNDFDGCLCGELLVKLYDCKIIGFSNSKDKLWLVDGNELTDDALFIDMFTTKYESVDQHIPPFLFENSCSPNKDRNIYAFDCYTRKYPFSTYIWLLCIAVKDGKNIESILPTSIYVNSDGFKKSDILFRADDSLLNTLKYAENCSEWIEYLIKYVDNNEYIKNIFDYMVSQKIEKIEKWKYSIDKYFNTNYGFKKEEIPDISTESARNFMKRLNIYFNEVTSIIELLHIRTTISTIDEFNKFYEKNKENLFSFAFVYSPSNKKYKNFSYSLFFKN